MRDASRSGRNTDVCLAVVRHEGWEISQRDLRNIDKLIAAGTLPKGHDAGELLMHYNDEIEAVRAGRECGLRLYHAGRMHGADRNDGSRHPDG